MNPDIQHKIALELGYSDSIISLTLSRFSFKTAGDLVEYLYEHEIELKQEVMETDKVDLRKETEYLYRQSLCVVCMKNLREIVTLPCCHSCLCVLCASCCFCPLKDCKMVITSKIRVYPM